MGELIQLLLMMGGAAWLGCAIGIHYGKARELRKIWQRRDQQHSGHDPRLDDWRDNRAEDDYQKWAQEEEAAAIKEFQDAGIWLPGEQTAKPIIATAAQLNLAATQAQINFQVELAQQLGRAR